MKSLNRKASTGGGVALLCAALALAACGYSLVGRGSTLPADIRNIYIAPLDNRTLRSQVDQILTAAITEEFIQRQRYSVVNNPGEADAELVGAVTGFSATPIAFESESDLDLANRYEITITAALRLQRTTNPPQLLWASDRYVFRSQYEAGEEESGVFQDFQSQAMEEIAEQFAQSLVIDVLEQF
ncbi:MAG: LPS assembly lipoprotein LptE [Thermoanaerobaculia bacterium]